VELSRAVVWTDHQQAVVIRFNAEASTSQHMRAHVHHTAQHGSGVRTEHEFFAELCAGLQAIPQVLVVGGHTVLADFRHYVARHRPHLAPQIVGYEVVDHRSERQLLALARDYFDRYERLAPAAVSKAV
jgi:hypothetical protein